ncbi:MAG: anthranilate synthase component I family protein [Aquificaceae bacterium]
MKTLELISEKFVADTETALSLYLKLRKSWKYSALLESAQNTGSWGRYSFLAFGEKSIKDSKKPLETLQETLKDITIQETFHKFPGGLVGFCTYETATHYAKVKRPKDQLYDCEDIFFFLTDLVVIYDNFSSTIEIIATTEDTKRAKEIIKNVKETIFKTPVRPAEIPLHSLKELSFDSSITDEEFIKTVKIAKEYIKEGDIIQVVLSRAFYINREINPLNLYRALRHINPSPYMFFLELEDITLVGSSPEALVKLENKKAYTRPIAGTRPRGKDDLEDRELEEELLKDPKEKAEHVMLVDLARNDLSRVCTPGSIKVSSLMHIEKFSHVMHLVSDVEGVLKEEISPPEVLKVMLPAGTVSGAPKVRAMQIISELEPHKRGIYAGAVGYISFNRNMDMAIAIRTAIIKEGSVFIQAGAGIVADSLPERELREIHSKAGAIMKAIKIAMSVNVEAERAYAKEF